MINKALTPTAEMKNIILVKSKDKKTCRKIFNPKDTKENALTRLKEGEIFYLDMESVNLYAKAKKGEYFIFHSSSDELVGKDPATLWEYDILVYANGEHDIKEIDENYMPLTYVQEVILESTSSSQNVEYEEYFSLFYDKSSKLVVSHQTVPCIKKEEHKIEAKAEVIQSLGEVDYNKEDYRKSFNISTYKYAHGQDFILVRHSFPNYHFEGFKTVEKAFIVLESQELRVSKESKKRIEKHQKKRIQKGLSKLQITFIRLKTLLNPIGSVNEFQTLSSFKQGFFTYANEEEDEIASLSNLLDVVYYFLTSHGEKFNDLIKSVPSAKGEELKKWVSLKAEEYKT